MSDEPIDPAPEPPADEPERQPGTLGLDRFMTKDMEECTGFLELIARGIPVTLAGIDVGWSPQQTMRRLKDPSFAELVEVYRDLSIDRIEAKVNEMAREGHFGAIQMVLFNRRPSDWRDVKHIVADQVSTVAEHVVQGVKEATLEMLRAGGIAALQQGGQLDDIIDAEVVEGGE